MSKEHTLTKASLGIDIAAILVLLVYFIVIAPYPPVGFGGLLVLSPPIFGIFGVITALLGQKRNKTNLSKVLIVINIIFLCWLPIVWYGGTLLLGT